MSDFPRFSLHSRSILLHFHSMILHVYSILLRFPFHLSGIAIFRTG